jgi:DNA-binding PadR family transcriptional regulator
MAEAREYLPLSSAAFEVLLTLAAGEQHGYRIMRDVAERSNGAVTLYPGTLYRTLSRLLETGLIAETGDRAVEAFDDQRRRYYRLTPLGLEVARAEARRLDAQLQTARRQRLLEGEPS